MHPWSYAYPSWLRMMCIQLYSSILTYYICVLIIQPIFIIKRLPFRVLYFRSTYYTTSIPFCRIYPTLTFPCFNMILMIGVYSCNYLVYGPQVCSWVLDCHIGVHLDVWQVASHGMLLLHSDLCCGFFLGLLPNFFHASLPFRSELPSWAGILSWTECPYSFCVGDSPPFLNEVLWYCSRVFLHPSFN